MRGETSNIRFEEAQKLLDYGFSNFEYLEYGKKDDLIKKVIVSKGTFGTVDAILENDVNCLVSKGTSSSISSNIVLDETVNAPIEKNQVLGKIDYYNGEELISSVNIVAKNEVKKLNFFNMYFRLIKNLWNLFR